MEEKMNIEKIKQDFPILKRKVHGKKLIYLDSAATSQKPKGVIDAMKHYYEKSNANVHRGVHQLGEESTIAYENAHKAVAQFINAQDWREIIFTKNTTEAVNLLAYSLPQMWEEGDEIIVSRKEHHSNFIPWQQAAKRHNLKLKILDIKEDGTINEEQLKKLLTKKTKIVCVTHISNVLGTINDIKKIAKIVHNNKTKQGHTLISIDGAQSVPHMPVNVQDLDCDFLSFSAHKMAGPMGIGVLYGKKELLRKMPPFLFGGGMIRDVQEQDSTWNDLPWKFEAGTPNVAGALGLQAAIEYLQNIGMKNVWEHSKEMAQYMRKKLAEQKDITIYGPKKGNLCAVVSFNIENIHAHDVIAILDKEGIAVRAGHHCAQPLMDKMHLAATVRISAYVYTTKEDIDTCIKALEKVKEVFA